MELVELCKSGSHQAFSELYVRYKDELLYYCTQYLKDEAEAEDVVQDIFMQLWETHASLDITSSFGGYIFGAARNHMLKLFRQFDVHARYAQHILIHTQELTNETEDAIVGKDYTTFLNKLIDSLPPMQKEVFRLNRIEELSYQEISELLHISVENVRKHISLSQKKIQSQFSKHKDARFLTIKIILIIFV
jgi:RNA polymerase sigma-70 factor (ECF subfamily)